MNSTFRRKLMCFLFIATFFATPTAQAALIPVDAGFGPGSGTLDTDTNLVFLDVNLTTGLSFDDVQAQLGPSGTFAGFRYATVSDVLDLFDSSGVFALNPISDTPIADEAAFFNIVNSLINIPAIDASGTGDVLAYRGLTGDPAGVPFARSVAELVIDRFTIDPSSSEIFSSTGAFLQDDIPAAPGSFPPEGAGVRSSGSWLVKTNEVPVPSTSSLMILGLLVFVFSRNFNRAVAGY